MSEFALFKNMLDRINAAYGYNITIEQRQQDDPNIAHIINLHNSGEPLPSGATVGYMNFGSEWHFDINGRLIRVGHWES